jgi:hypothetical protein
MNNRFMISQPRIKQQKPAPERGLLSFANCLTHDSFYSVITKLGECRYYHNIIFTTIQTFREFEFPFIISQIKTGAPMNEVTIPNGISDGEMIVLAIVSEISMNVLPISTEQGTEYL